MGGMLVRSVFRSVGRMAWRATVVGVVVAVSASAQTPTPVAADSMSTLRGVYTGDQAKRGKEAYLTYCRSCHLPSTGDTFAKRWAGKTILDLFTYIYETMPDNNPRSVSESDDADIIGYLLQVTGMPAGSRELPVVPDSLKAIRIEMKKEGPPHTGARRMK